MLINRIRFSIAILLFLTAIHCFSQSVTWEMEPTDLYNDVKYIGFNLFQTLSHDGKVGVIDSKGMVIVETTCDEITPFYEEYALLLAKNGDKSRVIGNLSTHGEFNRFLQEYVFYTLQGQAFYSCGLLTVEDNKGRKGYIDLKGKPTIGIVDGLEFSKIKPFCEGFAATFDMEKRYMLIDKSGKKEKLSFPNVVKMIPNGTNVFDGKVFVIDTQNEFYSYNVHTKGMCVKERPKYSTPDYLYRFSGKGIDIPYMILPPADRHIQLQESPQGYGYLHDKKVLLPSQFDQATPFINNLAIVRMNGKYGILRYSPDPVLPLSIEAVNPNSISYSAGESVICRFKVSALESMNADSISVTVNGDVATYQGNNIFSFKYKPTQSGKQAFIVSISYHGLVLLSSSLDFNFKATKNTMKKEEKEQTNSNKNDNTAKPVDKQNDKDKQKEKDKKKDKDKQKDKDKKDKQKDKQQSKDNQKKSTKKETSKKNEGQKKHDDIKLF